VGDVLHRTETVNPLLSPGSEFDYIDVSSISNLTYCIEKTQRLKGKDAPSRARKLVRSNDVLFATVRPTLRRVAIVPDELDNQICSTGYCVLRPRAAVDHRFVYYWLLSQEFLEQMAAIQKGASYPAVTDAEVKAQNFAYPPLPEQHRIVRILDEAFAAIAKAKANTEKNLQNAREVFETKLRSIFSSLISQATVPIGKVARVYDGPHATPKTVEVGPIFLGIGALLDGRVNLRQTRHVTTSDFEMWTRRVKPQANDIVFSYETRLGQAALIPEGLDCCLGRRMGLIRVDEHRVLARFLVYQYISQPFRHYLNSKVVKGATVDRISIKEFPSFRVALPPLAEQERIASGLDTVRESTERLEQSYRQKLAALDRLKQSLLHQAFSGNL